MYIAIIADNIANRKHMERLLGRTSDAMMSETGNLYIESYGEPQTMWPLIKRYNLFFVDITDPELKNTVITRLTELGLASCTVICQPQDTDFSSWPMDHGFLSLQHPLSVPVLSEIVRKIFHESELMKASQKIIEVRNEQQTEFIDADQILYAVANEHVVDVRLEDNSVIKHLGTLLDFKRLVDSYDEFQMIGKEVIVNNNHVTKKEGRNITLSNRHTIKLSLLGKIQITQ